MTNLIDLAGSFEDLWANETAPDLDSFLAKVGSINSKQLSQLVRIDQAARWQRGELCPVEQYFKRYPALETCGETAVDLIYHEYLLRAKSRENSSLGEFVTRFPEHAKEIANQVSFHLALERSSESMPADVDGELREVPEPEYDDQGQAIDVLSDSNRRGDAQFTLGRYRILEKVGTGSFGSVYKAFDPELDRLVAIKVPRSGGMTSEIDAKRFLREARSVARLRHPGIVSVYEIGQAQQTPYLVTEFVQGNTLAEVLSSQLPALRETAELITVVADALEYAHEMGVVHRDVKPANIMLDEDGAPRLMDFGLARRDAGEATMTIDGQMLGTPAYMSPEQARGESRIVDRRSDVYSLGVVLYQLLTGELPFRGTTPLLIHQLLHEEPPAPRDLRQTIPRDLETICLRAMAKSVQDRYVSARDMADDLRRFLRNEPIRARSTNPVERVWRWCRRKPELASLSAIVAILLVAIMLGQNAIVSLLLAAFATGGALTAVQFRRQAHKERLLRDEAEENLYYHRIALAHRDLTASLPRPVRAMDLLEACQPSRRNWEWNYLKQLWQSEPAILRLADCCEFRGLAFSPNGNQLAVACGDGLVRVWNRRTGEVIALPGHGGYVYSVAFNPADSNQLASSGNDRRVRVWNLKSRTEVIESLPGLEVYAVGMAYCVAFSPDGSLLAAASEEDTVRVWDAATGKLAYCLSGHDVHPSCVAFSGNGCLLATGDWTGVVRLWDLSTGQFHRKLQLPEHRYPVACLGFSPDAAGQYLAAGYFDNRVDVWETMTGKVHRELREHSGFVTSVVFHPRDARRLVSAGEDRIVRVWDVPSGHAILQLEGHIDNCAGLAFTPDGTLLASASYDRTIRLWNATALTTHPQERCTLQVGDEVWSVAVSRDGTQFAAAGFESSLRIWDSSGFELRTLSEHFSGTIFSLAFSPSGQHLAAVGFDGGVPPCVLKVIDLRTGQCAVEHREGQEIFAIEFSPDGQWLAFGLGDGSIMLADVNTCKEIISVGKHDRPIAYGCIKFRHDGLCLASASLDGTIRIWNSSSPFSNTQTERNAGPRSWTERLSLSLGNPTIAFWSVAFSPDGSQLLSGDKDGRLTLWDVASGAELEVNRDAPRGAYLSACFSPNGRWVISASEDCTVRVYDSQTLKLTGRYRGHLGPIRCLAVSSDFAVTGGSDSTVRLWDLTNILQLPK